MDNNLSKAYKALTYALSEKDSSKTSKRTLFTISHPREHSKDSNQKGDHESSGNSNGEQLLSDFMLQAQEPITWVEAREIWNDMTKTNNGAFPSFQQTMSRLLDNQALDDTCKVISPVDMDVDITERNFSPHDNEIQNEFHDVENDVVSSSTKSLSDKDAIRIAKGIKTTYSIRHSDDKSEFKFIMGALAMIWVVVIGLIIAGCIYPNNDTIGSLTPLVFAEAFALFALELIWECFLSWIVLKYNIKINYTRKLGNLFKVPKYFLADLLPFYESTSISLTTALAINQTLFCLIYYRKSRVNIPFFSYIFLSQDRREDRPDTLIFQVTEDIMRFGVYFPFKMLVVNAIGYPAIVFIPIAVNNIGDGLAEPVGVAWGRHKYTTTALYYKVKFWNGNFTRSWEGSSCVFIVTLIVVAANCASFTCKQFWITMTVLPFFMTIAEAKAPHTNDGPFMALVGCGFLSAVFLLL